MQKSKINTAALLSSYILKIFIVVLLAVSIDNKNLEWVFGASLGLIVSLIPSILKRNYEITLPLVIDLLITIALVMHIGGGILNAYQTITYYDIITHFVSSFLVAFLAFVIIYILHVYWDGLIMDKYAMAFLVVIVTVAMGVIWEYNEWVTDMIFGTNEQWGYADTLKDLFIDLLAGVFMAIVGVSLIKRGRFDDLTDDLGEQVDKKIIDRLEKRKQRKKQ